MTTTAGAATAILFHGAMSPGGTAAAGAMRDLHDLLADEGLQLEIHAWIDAGGPDGEQLYCVADLLARRFALDRGLASAAAVVVEKDSAALDSLDALGERCLEAGYDGAAHWCQQLASVLRPAPAVRTYLAAVGTQRRTVLRTFSRPFRDR